MIKGIDRRTLLKAGAGTIITGPTNVNTILSSEVLKTATVLNTESFVEAVKKISEHSDNESGVHGNPFKILEVLITRDKDGVLKPIDAGKKMFEDGYHPDWGENASKFFTIFDDESYWSDVCIKDIFSNEAIKKLADLFDFKTPKQDVLEEFRKLVTSFALPDDATFYDLSEKWLHPQIKQFAQTQIDALHRGSGGWLDELPDIRAVDKQNILEKLQEMLPPNSDELNYQINTLKEEIAPKVAQERAEEKTRSEQWNKDRTAREVAEERERVENIYVSVEKVYMDSIYADSWSLFRFTTLQIYPQSHREQSSTSPEAANVRNLLLSISTGDFPIVRVIEKGPNHIIVAIRGGNCEEYLRSKKWVALPKTESQRAELP